MYHCYEGKCTLNLGVNQYYTREVIDVILARIKSCIQNNRYTISLNENRRENIDFINEYNLCSDRQRSIFMQIEIDDFCYSVQNTEMGYEHEVLYAFVSQVQLFNAEGTPETVDVYTKFNVIDVPFGSWVVVVAVYKSDRL